MIEETFFPSTYSKTPPLPSQFLPPPPFPPSIRSLSPSFPPRRPAANSLCVSPLTLSLSFVFSLSSILLYLAPPETRKQALTHSSPPLNFHKPIFFSRAPPPPPPEPLPPIPPLSAPSTPGHPQPQVSTTRPRHSLVNHRPAQDATPSLPLSAPISPAQITPRSHRRPGAECSLRPPRLRTVSLPPLADKLLRAPLSPPSLRPDPPNPNPPPRSPPPPFTKFSGSGPRRSLEYPSLVPVPALPGIFPPPLHSFLLPRDPPPPPTPSPPTPSSSPREGYPKTGVFKGSRSKRTSLVLARNDMNDPLRSQ